MMWDRVLMKIKIVFMWINHSLIRILLEDLILTCEVIRDGPQGYSTPQDLHEEV